MWTTKNIIVLGVGSFLFVCLVVMCLLGNDKK